MSSTFLMGIRYYPGDSDGKESACSAGAWVQSLGEEDPLEKKVATHSSIPACKIPWTEEPGGLQFMESQRVRHHWATDTHTDVIVDYFRTSVGLLTCLNSFKRRETFFFKKESNVSWSYMYVLVFNMLIQDMWIPWKKLCCCSRKFYRRTEIK